MSKETSNQLDKGINLCTKCGDKLERKANLHMECGFIVDLCDECSKRINLASNLIKIKL